MLAPGEPLHTCFEKHLLTRFLRGLGSGVGCWQPKCSSLHKQSRNPNGTACLRDAVGPDGDACWWPEFPRAEEMASWGEILHENKIFLFFFSSQKITLCCVRYYTSEIGFGLPASEEMGAGSHITYFLLHVRLK